MHIAIVCQYYAPESVGPAIFLQQLATDLVGMGHRVSFVTSFPNYPQGRVFDGYRGRVFMRENLDGVEVVRTWIYATPSKSFWKRVLNFGSYCATSFFGALAVSKPDVIYCPIPPMPLAVSAEIAGWLKGAPVVVNVQDIYPDIAIELGYLKNRAAIELFQRMELWIYRHSAGVVVISERFRENLRAKGVPDHRLHVIPNWADAAKIRPGAKHNAFRSRLGVGDAFTIIYSGGLTHNSSLEVALQAAALLKGEPYRFVIVGEGVLKPKLEALAREYNLTSVTFLPFQPLEEYAQVLAAADAQLVSLHAAASHYSLPSKMLKIMAAGRALLAQATPDSDTARLIAEGDCGVAVDPADPAALAQAIRDLARQPQRLAQMGGNAREYFLRNFDRHRCIAQLEAVLRQAAGRPSPRDEGAPLKARQGRDL